MLPVKACVFQAKMAKVRGQMMTVMEHVKLDLVSLEATLYLEREYPSMPSREMVPHYFAVKQGMKY